LTDLLTKNIERPQPKANKSLNWLILYIPLLAFELQLYETGPKSQQNKPGKNQISQNFSIVSTTQHPVYGLLLAACLRLPLK
jgi:hypothetical protein